VVNAAKQPTATCHDRWNPLQPLAPLPNRVRWGRDLAAIEFEEGESEEEEVVMINGLPSSVAYRFHANQKRAARFSLPNE
jgi:hypothetical protein